MPVISRSELSPVTGDAVAAVALGLDVGQRRAACRPAAAGRPTTTRLAVTPSSRMFCDADSSAPVVLRSSCVRTSAPVLSVLKEMPGSPLSVPVGWTPRSLSVASVASNRPRDGDDDVGPALRAHRERLAVLVRRGDGDALDEDPAAAGVEERRLGRGVAAAQLQRLDAADVERRLRGEHDGGVELRGVAVDVEERVRDDPAQRLQRHRARAGGAVGEAAVGDGVDGRLPDDDQLLRPAAPVPRLAGLRRRRGGLRGCLRGPLGGLAPGLRGLAGRLGGLALLGLRPSPSRPRARPRAPGPPRARLGGPLGGGRGVGLALGVAPDRRHPPSGATAAGVATGAGAPAGTGTAGLPPVSPPADPAPTGAGAATGRCRRQQQGRRGRRCGPGDTGRRCDDHQRRHCGAGQQPAHPVPARGGAHAGTPGCALRFGWGRGLGWGVERAARLRRWRRRACARVRPG